MKNYIYRVYGLTILSELRLPELPTKKKTEPDVLIRYGKVPDQLPNPIGAGVLYQASKNDFLFKFNGIAKYRVQQGKYITIQKIDNAAPEEVRLFLLGSAIGALLHQRGLLALHGSCVARDNRGFIFSGNSSVGKSTIAAAFLKNGYSFVADDIAVIDFRPNNKYYIFPGIPHIKLWKDVIQHLDEKNITEKVRPTLEKYIKPITNPTSFRSVLLEKIIVLSVTNTSIFAVEEVVGAEKFNLLRNNTYRIQYVDKLQQIETHFKNLSKLASGVRVYKVERPPYPLLISELIEYIESRVINV